MYSVIISHAMNTKTKTPFCCRDKSGRDADCVLFRASCTRYTVYIWFGGMEKRRRLRSTSVVFGVDMERSCPCADLNILGQSNRGSRNDSNEKEEMKVAPSRIVKAIAIWTGQLLVTC